MIRWFEKHNKISWSITIFGAIMIFYLSSRAFEISSIGAGGSTWLSMVYHVSAFFLFSLFLLVSLIKGKIKYLLLGLGIIISIAYAISDEIHQFFVPGRFCTFLDVFLDATGILFASMFYLIFIKYREINS